MYVLLLSKRNRRCLGNITQTLLQQYHPSQRSTKMRRQSKMDQIVTNGDILAVRRLLNTSDPETKTKPARTKTVKEYEPNCAMALE
eukprot:6058321-Amphidinium_carterae.1